ncbi:MAG TPA: transglycosylase SLT domain-containing protein [Burkholderiales bacterium]|nr:transglycosylase SLT domain-containing protein [Burkholderiales bacterium]
MSLAVSLAARAFAALKASLAAVGLAALAVFFTLPAPRDALLGSYPLLPLAAWPDPFAVPTVVAAGPIQTPVGETAREREQRAVTEFIAKRYRVSELAVAGFVAAAYRAGAEYSVDPLLILAVMAVESRYNPVAESVTGAKGLMQVIPKFHLEKLLDHGGEEALLDPDVNITVGAQILREYQRRFGDTETALQMYAGAFDEPTSQYASKVLAEKARLEVLRQKSKKQSA